MDYWPGKAAGAPDPRLGSETTPEGLRRSKRIAALKAELTDGMDAIADDTLAYAVADATVAAEEVLPSGGKRKLRGGVKTAEAIKEVVRDIISSGPGALGVLDTALAKVIQTGRAVAVPAAGAAAVATALNHPTMFGNLAALSAKILQAGTNTTITATWGDWGDAIVGVKDALGTVAATVVGQSAQGPVVPVAIATAIMFWRAGKEGISITQLIKNDATAMASGVARVVTGQMQSFQEGRKAGESAMFRQQFMQLAETARTNKAQGPGAERMGVAARGAPLMAAEGGPAGVAIVRGTPGKDPSVPVRALAEGRRPPAAVGVPADVGLPVAAAATLPGRRSKRPQGWASRGDGAETDEGAIADNEAADDGAEPKLGKRKRDGGRKTKKAKKSKRRVTRRRKPFPSARMPVFAY